MYRTHTCGCLRAENVNQTVTLAGWVQKVRNLGAMTFIDLRDRYGITQVVIEEHSPAEARQTACCVGRECIFLHFANYPRISVNLLTVQP